MTSIKNRQAKARSMKTQPYHFGSRSVLTPITRELTTITQLMKASTKTIFVCTGMDQHDLQNPRQFFLTVVLLLAGNPCDFLAEPCRTLETTFHVRRVIMPSELSVEDADMANFTTVAAASSASGWTVGPSEGYSSSCAWGFELKMDEHVGFVFHCQRPPTWNFCWYFLGDSPSKQSEASRSLLASEVAAMAIWRRWREATAGRAASSAGGAIRAEDRQPSSEAKMMGQARGPPTG
eukprot:CAMPEP_0203850224 /NCGR_PEP_ID=MMETSP0359-20131031/6650_1 /ASSEMBLY_ACC=CAM_ASM_000338 /TAXON_ID=268821 /ORGANISM="Scrippsiella Hangoei, Strain SHTV-5" /LENGTH=235 /DNA_ID=CAMNT_0050766093 /DNA_START=18 /DNA_END=722 /DNA_ORIENTATION=+